MVFPHLQHDPLYEKQRTGGCNRYRLLTTLVQRS